MYCSCVEHLSIPPAASKSVPICTHTVVGVVVCPYVIVQARIGNDPVCLDRIPFVVYILLALDDIFSGALAMDLFDILPGVNIVAIVYIAIVLFKRGFSNINICIRHIKHL